jgi:hypothetical protein
MIHGQRHYRHAHTSRPLDWAVDIPRIGVAAPVIRLGGPRSGDIAVPTFAQVEDVGWYRYGAVPGQRGNAVFLGHVDTYQGPAVFYDLYELLPGDQVEVDLGHHDTQRFTVHWVKEVLKTHFPASKVFGGTDGRHLWLVTCGGQFDYDTRSYLSNIVVYTTADARHARRAHHRRDAHASHATRPHSAESGPAKSPAANAPAAIASNATPPPVSGKPADASAAKAAKAAEAAEASAAKAAHASGAEASAAKAAKAADASAARAADLPGSVASAATAALMRSGRLTPPLVFSTQR